MKKIAIFSLLSFLISCDSQSNSQQILGSWTLYVPEVNFSMNLKFLDRNTVVFKFKDSKKVKIDTIVYKFIDDDKKLIFTEKNGDIEKFEINQVSQTDLVLIKTNDTLHFKKD